MDSVDYELRPKIMQRSVWQWAAVDGALGSNIQSYMNYRGRRFRRGGIGSLWPFPWAQTGDITFTAKVTSTRGRTATSTSNDQCAFLAWAALFFSNPKPWRSSDAGCKEPKKGTYARLFKSGVSYSSLDSQNSVTLKGPRVYPKGGRCPLIQA